ncbi:MAG: peptidoglycan-binding protein, partial [Ilumatobacteraceae bacterium]
MSSRCRRMLLGGVATLAASITVALPSVARAADNTPWVLPSMPPACTGAAMAAGNVQGCLVTGWSGRPESRGWPAPPFPSPDAGGTASWSDLGIGSSGSRVVAVQQALTAAGFPLLADGQFGQRTQTAVSAFQAAQSLPSSGVVDAATAGALGILASAPATFPPAGWSWLGWAYNGSAALAGWESQLVRNRVAIGRVPVGGIRSMPDAQPLFEGFIREIVAGGYRINDFGNYAFRCTSNSRKSCEGQTIDQLSNHAYGLAVDLNTTANPELTYSGINGATACSTPIRSDIPMWVVRAAERWGLYWGGYGWNGGCSTPTQWRASILRDTMHFEFRGTPAIARAIAARNASGTFIPDSNPNANYAAITPVRLLDTRGGNSTVDGQGAGAGSSSTGSVVEVTVAGRAGIPAEVTAVALNVTVTGTQGAGYVTAFPCGTPLPPASNLNFDAGQTVPNLVVAKVGAGGKVCLFTSAATHLIVDANGWFRASAGLAAIDSARVLDTRSGASVGAGSVTAIPVAGVAGVPVGAAAVALNVTATGAEGDGWAAVFPCGTPTPTASNLNVGRGQTVANLVVAKVGGDGTVCVLTSVATHLVVDLGGWLSSSATYGPLNPARLLDSRPGAPTIDGAASGAGLRPAGSVTELVVTGRGGVPSDAAAVALNVTVTEAQADGYVTVFPCEAALPGSSNLNFRRGQMVPNLVIAKVGTGGRVCLF